MVPLTSKEFALLEFLAHRAGEVVDRLDILEHCWDHAYEPESNVVDVHVRGLRRKLGDGIIETVRGAGYRVPDDEPAPAGEPEAPVLPSGTVTVLFTDIVESTDTTERIGDRAWFALLEEHNALIRAQLVTHKGYEVKSTGDGFMLAFDSARQGLECAIGIQRALAERNAEHPDAEINVRTGLHTGEPIWGDNDFHGRGIALAARIGAKAEAGEILVSTLLRELTESLGDFEFAGSPRRQAQGPVGPPPAPHRELVTFLDALATEDAAELRRRGTLRSFKRGAALAARRPGRRPRARDHLGHVKVARPTDQGRDVMLALRGPGDLVGEQAALDDQPRSASIIALGTVDALALTRRTSWASPPPARPPRDTCCGCSRCDCATPTRKRSSSAGRRPRPPRPAPRRAAASAAATEATTASCIDLPLTQEDLASWVGTSRESASRALQQMRDLGWVTTARRAIVVSDLDALRARC